MSRKFLALRVYGVPRPQGSKRYVGNGRFVEASDVKPWRQAIAKAVFDEFVATSDSDTFTEPVVIEAVFFLPKPKTVKRVWPSVAPDLDKLCRAVGDGLSVDSNALDDDSLIVRWDAAKVYAISPELAGVSLKVRLADEKEMERANG